MAEIGKGVTAGKLAINVQKRLTRAQEKVRVVNFSLSRSAGSGGSHGSGTQCPAVKLDPITLCLQTRERELTDYKKGFL